MARFWRYHGFEVVFRGDEMDVYGASPCKHLRYNHGLAECAIYVSRPEFCHDFLCESAK
jgi:Fe-S-cluster containining protein